MTTGAGAGSSLTDSLVFWVVEGPAAADPADPATLSDATWLSDGEGITGGGNYLRRGLWPTKR